MLLDTHLTSREIQAAEYNANYLGISNLLLMEAAGAAVAEVVIQNAKHGARVYFACGLGGNGGDGLVAARILATRGYHVKVALTGLPQCLRSQETKHNFQVIESMRHSVDLSIIQDSSDVKQIKSDVIVDALIGYSYRGNMDQITVKMVQAINDSKAYVVSIDVPTGMIVDTGEIPIICVEADTTVTFYKPKIGFKSKPKELGKLVVAPLSIPFEAETFTGPGDVLLVHKQRTAESHKGMYGRLLVIGGSETYHGAPTLTSLGAQATGIDLVYTAVPETAAPLVAALSPSMIVVKLKSGRLSPSNIDQIEPFLEKVNALAIGPGLGMANETRTAVHQIIKIAEELELPMIIDADGLKAFGENRRKLRVPTVFTPHSSEYEALTGVKVEGDWKQKGAIVEEQAKKLGSVILLKGSVDVISDGIHTRYNWTGNPGMTVGGTGDVLTGIVAGFVAQGNPPMQAACASAFINGAAGDMVFADRGYHIKAEDLIPNIPYVIEDSINNRLISCGLEAHKKRN